VVWTPLRLRWRLGGALSRWHDELEATRSSLARLRFTIELGRHIRIVRWDRKGMKQEGEAGTESD
jgi:hypothetical protein